MKKVLVSIVIIIVIISICIFAFNKKDKQTFTEKNYDDEIEEYISQIYGNMYNLPEFKDINEADEKWLWDNLITYITKTKELDSIYYDKDELTDFAKELYGTHLNKQFPDEGTESIFFDKETNKYIIGGYGLNIIPSFAVDSTKLIKDNLYEAIIIEYKIDLFGILKDYEDLGLGSAFDVYNMNDEKIEQFDSTYNNIFNKIKQYVKQNKTKFTEKKLILKLDNETNKFYVISSEKI